jgi:CHAT domain-containing protein/Tfp pilus assembly protein PilF
MNGQVVRGTVLFLFLLFAGSKTLVAEFSGDRWGGTSRESLAVADSENSVGLESETIARNRSTTDAESHIGTLARRAEAYLAQGRYAEALADLGEALALAEKGRDLGATVFIGAQLGTTYLRKGDLESARHYLTASLGRSRESHRSELTAAVLNDLGSIAAAEQKHDEALNSFQESARLASERGDRLLAARAAVNAARIYADQGHYAQAGERLDAATAFARTVTPAGQAPVLIAIGQLHLRLVRDARILASLVSAREALTLAARIGEQIADRRTLAQALGYLGSVHEFGGDEAEALNLTRRAIFAAQEANTPEILYRWQWQMGRLLKARGDMDGAIAAHRQAVYHLRVIRGDLARSPQLPRSHFREAVKPVFLDLADALLQRSEKSAEAAEKQRYLQEARETVELSKAAEIQDFFQDECVSALQSKITKLDRIGEHTAALYPILLPDRMELLLSLKGRIERVTVVTTADAVAEQTKQFRQRLEKRTTREYLANARVLYDWLLAPITDLLRSEGIDTLVFVPDGPLYAIPLAALHDGRQFLIEKFAVAVTPGLDLVDPRPLSPKDSKVLAGGITASVQGFPALPNVPAELDDIQRLYRGTRLQDQQFAIPKLESELLHTPYSIVHLASHGQFMSDARKTFVLAYDGRLTMDRLEYLLGFSRFRDEPVELLTLSACETAAGDHRAALGLAGIAIKAGARSALATLWLVNDQATSLLTAEFYRRLQNASVSKAKALQQAQLTLVRDARYRHPGYWSPFLLIGNWL